MNSADKRPWNWRWVWFFNKAVDWWRWWRRWWLSSSVRFPLIDILPKKKKNSHRAPWATGLNVSRRFCPGNVLGILWSVLNSRVRPQLRRGHYWKRCHRPKAFWNGQPRVCEGLRKIGVSFILFIVLFFRFFFFRLLSNPVIFSLMKLLVFYNNNKKKKTML